MTGSGTAGDPYVIWDVNDLQDVGNGAPYLLTDYYELGQDIDASATAGWNWNAGRGVFEGFDPLADYAAPFTGHFDGQYWIISGLYCNRYYTSASPGIERGIGLFNTIAAGGRVQHLFLIDCDIRADGVDDVHGNYSPKVGAVTGMLHDSTSRIYRVFTTGSVQLLHHTAAGPTGGAMGVGGIAGQIFRATVLQCASEVNVVGNCTGSGWWACAGGLVGFSTGYVTDSYARGSVTALGTTAAVAAGAVGVQHYNFAWNMFGTVTRVYATGAVSTPAWPRSYGLVGVDYSGTWTGSTYDSFWDRDTTGQTSSSGGTGRTTAQMKTQSNYTDAGWNFVTIWDIDGTGFWNDGYPFFTWDPASIFKVVVPDGGEVWDAGSTYTILWTHSRCRDPSTQVRIELLKGGLLDETIIASTPIGPLGGGNYNWTIDPDKNPGSDYRVRVTGVTNPFTDTSDDDFKIRGPVVPAPAPAVATLPATGVG